MSKQHWKKPSGGLWENNEGGHLAREISEGFLEEVLSGSPGQGWRELSENPGERDLRLMGSPTPCSLCPTGLAQACHTLVLRKDW